MDNIYDVNEMLDYLYASDVLTADMKEDIGEQSTKRKRKEFLMNLLPSLGPRAFQVAFYVQHKNKQKQ